MAVNPRLSGQVGYFTALSSGLSALIAQYANRNAPSALMISGQFGVGKASFARILAQALMCDSSQRPCGTCAACTRVQMDNHPNLLRVKAEERQKSVKVEQARALLDSLASHPFETGARVVVLELIDIFTPQAQNALLKALEEPDSSTLFIMTCQNDQAVLPTIRSRCQSVTVPAWGDELLENLLVEQGIPAEEAAELTTLAQGSPGKALLIRQNQNFWAAKKQAEASFLSLESLEDFPAASANLRDAKEQAGILLDYTQDAALRMLRTHPGDPDVHAKAQSLLETVLTARQYQASNLSWQAIADWMLLNIIKERPSCQT